jgi:uncharacterized protein with FMN-binding domain
MKKTLQKLIAVFFTGTFMIVLVVGVLKIKKQSPSMILPGGSSDQNSLNNSNTQTLKTSATSPATTLINKNVTTSSVKTTFTGNSYATMWGNVTASIAVQNGKIISVNMPDIPNSPPSQYAQPILVQEALQVGSANIQGVSGATYTSQAFIKSLESAIAMANSAVANSSGGGLISSNNSSPSSVSSSEGGLTPSAGTGTVITLPATRTRYYNYDND